MSSTSSPSGSGSIPAALNETLTLPFIPWAGFLLVAYAVQTLFVGSITAVMLMLGWWLADGDPAWSRLDIFAPPEQLIWVDLLPPMAVLALAQWGSPVRTSFLVLSAFVPRNLQPLLVRSLVGYLLAFAVTLPLYAGFLWLVERRVLGQAVAAEAEPAPLWTGLQWLSTAWLLCQWLVCMTWPTTTCICHGG